MTYTDAEHRNALDHLRSDLKTVVVQECPKCGEPMEYAPPTWEGSDSNAYGLSRVRGGWACPDTDCGGVIEDERTER